MSVDLSTTRVRLDGPLSVEELEQLRTFAVEAIAARREVRVVFADPRALDLLSLQLLVAWRRDASLVGLQLHVEGLDAAAQPHLSQVGILHALDTSATWSLW